MKRIVFITAALVFVLGIGTAFAASPSQSGNSLQAGKIGMTVGMGDSIFGHNAIPEVNGMVNNVVNIDGRYLLTKDMAITAGFGLQVDGSDADATYFSINGGFRKYLRTDDFAPFVAGVLSIAYVKANPGIADETIIDLAGLFGAEYFLSKQFSLEGAVGVGVGDAKDNRSGGGSDVYFGTRTVGVRANFYF